MDTHTHKKKKRFPVTQEQRRKPALARRGRCPPSSPISSAAAAATRSLKISSGFRTRHETHAPRCRRPNRTKHQTLAPPTHPLPWPWDSNGRKPRWDGELRAPGTRRWRSRSPPSPPPLLSPPRRRAASPPLVFATATRAASKARTKLGRALWSPGRFRTGLYSITTVRLFRSDGPPLPTSTSLAYTCRSQRVRHAAETNTT